MQLPRNPQELEACLIGMTIPDTEQVAKANAVLKAFLKTPEGVEGFLLQLANSQRPEARQLAGVLLRKKLWSKFKAMPAEKQEGVKKMLLERVVAEPLRPVRIAVAALISSLAKRLVPDNKWKELLQFLLQMSKSQTKEHREVAMILFRALAENIPDSLAPHFRTLLGIFTAGLKDPSSVVALEALRSIGTVVELVDSEDKKQINNFREVVPEMVAMVKIFIDKGEQEAANVALSVLDSLALSPIPVLTPHMALLAQMMLACCSHKGLDIMLRQRAGEFLATICNSYAGKLQKSGLVDEILKVGVALTTEPWEDEWDSTSMTPHTIAVEFLDALCLNIPRKLFFGPLMGIVQTLLQSSRPDDRKGAMVIISIIAEACAPQFAENIENITKMVCERVKDPSTTVRAGACVALTQMTLVCQPPILELHSVVIPHVLLGLNEQKEDAMVKKRLLTALHTYIENLAEDVLPYIASIMQAVERLLAHPDKDVQSNAINTISACALAAGKKFLPFYKETISLMGRLMSTKDDEKLPIRARATECSGAIAKAVGRDVFQPLLAQFLKLSVEGMALEYLELREATFRMWSHWAAMLGKDLEPLLPTFVTMCLASLASNDGVEFTRVDENELNDGLDKLDSDEDANDREMANRKVRLNIRTAALEEKVSALCCLGTIIKEVQEKFLPYVERTLKELDEMYEFTHEQVRRSAVNTLRELLQMLGAVYPLPGGKGAQRGQLIQLPKETRQVVEKHVPVFIDRMVEEEDKMVAGAACEALVIVCRNFGLGAVKNHLDDMLKAVSSFLTEQAPCQNCPDDEGGDEEVEKEHDEYVIDSVTDLVSALAFVLGKEFFKPFKKMIPAVLKYGHPKRAEFDRSMCWGTFAEVAMEMEEAFIPLLPQVFPEVLKALGDPAASVRRNAAFCTGTLCSLGPQTAQYYQPALAGLAKLYALPPAEQKMMKEERAEYEAARDNACSAVAKMIMTAPQALPLEECIKMLLSGMPLLEDMQEVKPVYTCMLKLFQEKPQLMMPHAPAIIKILADVLGDDAIPSEVMANLVHLARSLAQELSSKKALQPVLEQMGAEEKANFIEHTAAGAPGSPAAAPASA